MSASEHPPEWTANASGALEKSASPRRKRHEQHGASADLALAPRAEELADSLRDLVPASSASDEPTIRLLGLVLAHIERANLYLDERGILDRRGSPRAVLKVLSAWENTAARLLRDLGMTPASRAHLGLELVRTEAAVKSGADLSRLSRAELAEFRRLAAKAEATDA